MNLYIIHNIKQTSNYTMTSSNEKAIHSQDLLTASISIKTRPYSSQSFRFRNSDIKTSHNKKLITLDKNRSNLVVSNDETEQEIFPLVKVCYIIVRR